MVANEFPAAKALPFLSMLAKWLCIYGRAIDQPNPIKHILKAYVINVFSMSKMLIPKRQQNIPNKNGGNRPNLLPRIMQTIDPGMPRSDEISIMLLSD